MTVRKQTERDQHAPGDYVITTYRCAEQTKAVGVVDQPAGNWWYALNDGLLDVGPFISEEAAVEAALRSLEAYARDMGGYFRSVSHRKGAAQP